MSASKISTSAKRARASPARLTKTLLAGAPAAAAAAVAEDAVAAVAAAEGPDDMAGVLARPDAEAARDPEAGRRLDGSQGERPRR